MKALRNYLDKIKPNFEEGGKLAMFRSVFEGFETFLFVPNTTSKSGVHIHDSIDSKRTMTVVIIALLPALLFGMYNVGYQHNLAIGANPGFWMTFLFGFLAVLPKIIVSYVVGLGIEFAVAQWKKEEIQEGFLVSGILIPMIVPVDTPLWMIAVATAFAVIFAKEVFGGTGYNVFNVALVTRAFLFFAYPSSMSGDQIWVRTADTFGLGAGQVVDGFSAATPLGIAKVATTTTPEYPWSLCDMVTGFIRLNGVTVGAVANGEQEMSARGAQKAADFVNFCDAFNIPVLTVTNVKGYKASLCSERNLAKAAARLTYAFANATVPKVNVIAGEAFGSAYVTMNSKGLGADLVFAWKDAKIGMMDAGMAAKVMYADADAQTQSEKAKEYAALQDSVEAAARRGYVDAVIDAADTRKQVIGAFEMLFTKREGRPDKKHGTV